MTLLNTNRASYMAAYLSSGVCVCMCTFDILMVFVFCRQTVGLVGLKLEKCAVDLFPSRLKKTEETFLLLLILLKMQTDLTNLEEVKETL